MLGWSLISLGVGLVAFFSGIRLLTGALRNFGAARLDTWMPRLTGTPPVAFTTGFVLTALCQSSSFVSITAISLVNAGFLTFPQAFAVVLGANLGTTLTAHLAAWDLAPLGPPAVLTGALLAAAGARHPSWQRTGYTLAAVGGILFGLASVSGALAPLVDTPAAIGRLAALGADPWLAAGWGAGVTAIVQSSSAVTALATALAHEGAIPVPLGVAIVLGSNVGTVADALLASLAGGTDGRRTAIADLVLNVLAAAVCLVAFDPLMAWLAHLPGGAGHRVASAHTAFNLLTAAVGLAALRPYTGLIRALVPR